MYRKNANKKAINKLIHSVDLFENKIFESPEQPLKFDTVAIAAEARKGGTFTLQVRGKLERENQEYVYVGCPNCLGAMPVSFGEEYLCNHCNVMRTASNCIRIAITMYDRTGEVEVVFFTQQAEKLLDKTSTQFIVDHEQDFARAIGHLKERLQNFSFVLRARAKIFKNKPDFTVDSFKLISDKISTTPVAVESRLPPVVKSSAPTKPQFGSSQYCSGSGSETAVDTTGQAFPTQQPDTSDTLSAEIAKSSANSESDSDSNMVLADLKKKSIAHAGKRSSSQSKTKKFAGRKKAATRNDPEKATTTANLRDAATRGLYPANTETLEKDVEEELLSEAKKTNKLTTTGSSDLGTKAIQQLNPPKRSRSGRPIKEKKL